MPTSKKFFDILPPKETKKSSYFEKKLKEVPKEKKEIEIKVKVLQKPSSPPFLRRGFKFRFCSKKKEFSNFWRLPQKLTVFAAVFLIAAGIFCQFLLAKTKIIIFPQTETKGFTELITLNSDAWQIDMEEKIIPGKIFEEEKNATQQFSTSGKVLKEERAFGQIRVYNAYSTLAQVLVANTRFLSDDGKLFKSVERITLPGGVYEKSNVLGQKKLTPGYIDIKAVAAESGPDYNIGPSTFSIPGFAGTPKYTAFYGKSFSPMEGGFQGQVPKLSKEDLDNAQDVLVARLKKEGKDSLQSKIPASFILLEEGISYETLETSSSVKVGAEVETFNFRAKMKIIGMGVERKSLEDFATAFIIQNMPEDKKIQQNSLKIEYVFQSANLSAGKSVLNLKFGAKIFAGIDLASLKKAILGKSITEAKILLEDQPQVVKVSLQNFPFWLKTIPQEEERVKMELRVAP